MKSIIESSELILAQQTSPPIHNSVSSGTHRYPEHANEHFSDNHQILNFRRSLADHPGKFLLIFLSLVIIVFLAEPLWFFLKFGTGIENLSLPSQGSFVAMLSLIPIGLLISLFFSSFNCIYQIDREFVTKRIGRILFISTSSLQSYLNEIRSIEITQSMAQRVFNLGNITIRVIGSDRPEIIMEGIYSPWLIKSIIEHRRHLIKAGERRFHHDFLFTNGVNEMK